MKKSVQPYERYQHILRILAKNGPMSVSGLKSVTDPPIHTKPLQLVLRRLNRRGVLQKRCDSAYGTHYYYIARNPAALKLVKKWIDVPVEELRVPCFRHTELLHSQACALWQHKLEGLFPAAKVLREHEYASSALASDILLSFKNVREARPDLLVLHPSAASSGWIAVGVEVERFLKSRKRLIKKLDLYGSRSRLDGLIYVCSSDTIVDTLRSVWRSEVIAQALRINHYGHDFLLFTDGRMNAANTEPVMHNAALSETSVSIWLHRLARTALPQRRDGLLTR